MRKKLIYLRQTRPLALYIPIALMVGIIVMIATYYAVTYNVYGAVGQLQAIAFIVVEILATGTIIAWIVSAHKQH